MMKRFFIASIIMVFFCECLAFAETTKDKMVLRYVVRSTKNGDTEMSISAKDGSVEVKRELQKLNCPRTWDKTCFAQRTYKGKISVVEAKELIGEVKVLFDLPKADISEVIDEDQYAIGLLVDEEKPKYANAAEGTLKNNKLFKKIQLELQKIVKRFSKI